MKVISIDPAWNRPYAVATFKDGIFQDCSLMEVSNIGWVISKNAKKKSELVVVVEEAYIGINKRGARDIAYSVGGVIGLCKFYQVKYELMSIKRWKTEHNLTEKTDKMRLVVMKYLVSKIAHIEIDNIDEQCAILIGQAWINQNGGNK